MERKNHIGKTYGRLTVIGEAEMAAGYKRRLICRCSCGNEVVVLAGNLTRGHTTSCGCAKREIV